MIYKLVVTDDTGAKKFKLFKFKRCKVNMAWLIDKFIICGDPIMKYTLNIFHKSLHWLNPILQNYFIHKVRWKGFLFRFTWDILNIFFQIFITPTHVFNFPSPGGYRIKPLRVLLDFVIVSNTLCIGTICMF